ncbi:MAG TPA: DUF177 domain-containing protein [Polyangiaceae bacterium]|jgi:uncharacterized protein|nr:DUF177 domain-containing protein [Polyangiaceae bacterium]
MSAHEFSIPVHDLDAAGKELHLPIRAAWIRGALEETGIAPGGEDGGLEIRVSKSGNDVVVHGRLHAELAVPCARCLEPTHVSIQEEVSALAVQGAPPQRSSHSGDEDDADDLSPDEADVIAYDGQTVVLDDLVRDELLLNIPMIPLCSDSCPGISPPPAAESAAREEDDIDPRLSPLLRLKKK